MRRPFPSVLSFTAQLRAFVALFLAAAGCNGARPRPAVTPDPPASAAPGAPSLRLYYLVDLDGYLEPCGCQSRPLGGIDRLARLLEAEQAHAPPSLLLAAGDLLYRDPTLDPMMVSQESRKAEALVRILDQMQLTAYAPGPSDFARGGDAWRATVRSARATALVANTRNDAQLHSVAVREVGGVRIALVGVSDFREAPDADPPAGAPATTDPVAAAEVSVAAARRAGARVVVVLASVPRRAAVAIARSVPGVDFVIAARTEGNVAPPPERVGNAFVLSATNQGRSVGIVDLYLRDSGALADGSAASAVAERASLDRRITELRERLSAWERDPSVDRAAVSAQRARLAQLERDRVAVERPRVPARGSYFDARVQEIAPELPKRADVQAEIATYFRAVNEANRAQYATLRAPEPAPGQAHYVGAEACRDCHEEDYQVWIRTPHSNAYRTLQAVTKEFNLSCVGCHVTGYRQPGGSEVVQNEGLRDVQCESCHGPGSLHSEARTAAARRATIRLQVPASFCAGNCHTPEHSDQFNYETYLPHVLGPGHGYALGSDAGVQLSAPVLFGAAATPPRTALSTSDAAAAPPLPH